MSNPTETALEHGLQAVRDMADDPAPANDAPDAAGDDARVHILLSALQEAGWAGLTHNDVEGIIALDPATSRIRALEEANRALVEKCQVFEGVISEAYAALRRQK